MKLVNRENIWIIRKGLQINVILIESNILFTFEVVNTL